MSDLERCPFCGSPVHIKRDAASGLGDFVCADGAPCRGSKLIVAFPLEHEAVAIEAWNRRAQPAQAGQVLTADEIDSIAKPFIRSVGDHWCNEPAIREQSVEDLARAIESAVLARVARVPQWLPIETAPKDGSVVDLWHSEFGRMPGWYWGLPHHCCGEMGSYCDSDWHSLEPGWVDEFNEPHSVDADVTHWMPLPPPPGIVGEKGGQ